MARCSANSTFTKPWRPPRHECRRFLLRYTRASPCLVASAGSCFSERPDCTNSPQANKQYPRSKTLIAPTISALYSYPHSTHSNRACVWRFSVTQSGHVRLVWRGGTASTSPPSQAARIAGVAWTRISPGSGSTCSGRTWHGRFSPALLRSCQ